MFGREICEFTCNAVDIVVCLRVKDYPPKQTRKRTERPVQAFERLYREAEREDFLHHRKHPKGAS